MLLIESQLLARKQYLGTYGSPGRKRQSHGLDAVGNDGNRDQKQQSEELCGPKHLHGLLRDALDRMSKSFAVKSLDSSSGSGSKEFLLLGSLQHLAILDATRGQHFDFGFLLTRHIAASLGRNDKRLRAIGQIKGALELQGLHAALLARGFQEGRLERVRLRMQLIGDLRWEHGHNHRHRRLDFDADLLAIMVRLEAAVNLQE